MLSGVADEAELKKHDIKTVKHLSGVGQNLQDHLFTFSIWRQHGELHSWNEYHTDPAVLRAGYDQLIAYGSGPLADIYNGKWESVTHSPQS
jgi:choline dehydrogenase-like flavoprotein